MHAMRLLSILALSLTLLLTACSREYALAVLQGIERSASAPITTCRTTTYASRGPRTTSYTTCSTYEETRMSEYETAPDIFCYPFDNVFEVRIPGSLHQLGTQALMITVLDTHNPPEPIWWALTDTGPVAPETYDVTLHFPKPETGVVHLRVMYL